MPIQQANFYCPNCSQTQLFTSKGKSHLSYILSSFLFLLTLNCVLIVIAPAQNLKADYQFQGNLSSSVAGAPPGTHLVGSAPNSFVTDTVDGYTRQTLRFPFNSGIALFNTNTVIPNNSYTIVALFKFDELSGYRRIADFKNGSSQTGAYFLDGRYEAEPTTNPALIPGTYFQAVLVREPSGRVRAYRDGVLRVDIPNDNGIYQISSDNVLRFAQDDLVFGGQASAGNLARVRLYDSWMSPVQVQLLDRLPVNGGGDQSILFTSGRNGNSDIYTMNTDGSNQRRPNGIIPANANDLGDWSPNGQKIVFSSKIPPNGREGLWLRDADGTNQTILISDTIWNYHYAHWSPDGTKIAYGRCNINYICDIFVMNADGSNQVNLTPNTGTDEDFPTWSPDGSKIVFTSNRDGDYEIFVMNINGTGIQQLTSNTTNDLNPNWSPDGTKIAFESFRNGTTSEIYVMNFDGSNQTRLTNNAVNDSDPAWSPDNTKLVFSSKVAGATSEIYTINVNGGSTTRLTFNSTDDTNPDWKPQAVARRSKFDFDGDGTADVSVFRPSVGAWYINQSSNNAFKGVGWGQVGDVIAPADYDGDGRTDVAVFRNGYWYWLNSSNNSFSAVPFGQTGDIPIPADYDNDGKADVAVFRPTGQGNPDKAYFYILESRTNSFRPEQFGREGDMPASADFDGDGKADVAVYRDGSSAGGRSYFFYRPSSQPGADFNTIQWGLTGDKPAAADFDGDGKQDAAVFRPSAGDWYILRSSNNQFFAMHFGIAEDVPVPADYDGDSRSDIAVFRPSVGSWYLQRSTAGFTGIQFGVSTDKPIPAFLQQQ